MLREPMPN